MASIKKPVTFSGTLRGEGHQATCTVSATKVSVPGTGDVAYANYFIERVSQALPDRSYQLTVNGETISARR